MNDIEKKLIEQSVQCFKNDPNLDSLLGVEGGHFFKVHQKSHASAASNGGSAYLISREVALSIEPVKEKKRGRPKKDKSNESE